MKLFGKIGEYFTIFLIIVSLNFLIPRLMPGDPFTYLSSEEGDLHQAYSEEQIERYKEYYGLNKPLGQQYISYMKGLLRGDLGISIYYGDDVLKLILDRAIWTLSIVLISLFISSVIGTMLGSLSAWYRDGVLDKILYPLMIILSEIPSFLIGIFLLFVFGAHLKYFPLSGGKTVFSDLEGWENIKDLIMHGTLPTISLVLSQLGGFYLLARNSMITVLSKDYMRTAQAKGLNTRKIIFKHGLKNSILPIVTRIFLSLGSILSGAILVENVFNYPGLGKLMKEAVIVRDYTLIQGIFLFVTFFVLIMNFLSDLLYKKIDPRLNYED